MEIVEPLKHGEAEVVRSNFPETVEVGKAFSLEIEFRNATDRDSSIVSTISRRRDLGDWKEVGYVSLNIAASSERWWHQTEWQIEEPGNYQYRVDAIDDGWATVAE